MKKLTSGVLTGALAAALAASLTQTPASAAPAEGDAPGASAGTPAAQRPDNRPGPLTKERQALRQAAVQALVEGRATKEAQPGGGSKVDLGKGKAVEFFDNDKQAKVLTILSEFGETVVGKYGGAPGPLHNKITPPKRSEDNSTTWEADYNKAYYEKLFNGPGESMKTYYDTVSGGQYDVTNTVEDWVKVPYNGAYYGANPREDQGGAWDFIEDTGNAWYDKQIAAKKTPAEIDAYLSQFDQWDRYDHDGDENFNEPDGYIDHFQTVHAGEGEEAGASPDTIWSHRWYVNGTDFGKTGPTVGDTQVKFGGARIGQSKYWLGDYTVEPENGGLGVFVHEYGHDLDLPDFYDTAGGDNGTAFWTVMSGGSWMGHGADIDGTGPDTGGDGIGTTPSGMGPDEKLFLGWLNHQRLPMGKSGKYTLSPASAKTAAGGTTQAVLVELPDEDVVNNYTTPPEGTHAWWSGRADNLNNTLTRSVPAASSVTVNASAWYQIEAGYDYLYGEYSTDGGQSWQSAGAPIDGTSRGWQNVSWSYRPNGQATLFQLRYQTDGGVNEAGAFLDNIAVTADRTTVGTDGAENSDHGWTVKGWTISTGTDSYAAERYYLLENRQHVGFDQVLGEGPYNFTGKYFNWVEFFRYQPGMLVWFADKSQPDNNTSEHVGYGQALPVDARPKPLVYRTSDGTIVGKPGNRRQPFDATFGLESVNMDITPETTDDDGGCLHTLVTIGNGKNAVEEYARACPTETDARPTFDDSLVDRYWSKDNPLSSTKVAGHGVTATVVAKDGNNLLIQVNNPRP